MPYILCVYVPACVRVRAQLCVHQKFEHTVWGTNSPPEVEKPEKG